MREKLINLIYDSAPIVYAGNDFVVDYVKIADHLIANGVTLATDKNVTDKNVGKWIPVSERLPDPRCSIEMYFPSKEMVCLGFLENVVGLDIWCVYTPNNANVCQIKPTHWRYRAIAPTSPEPPKEGNNE